MRRHRAHASLGHPSPQPKRHLDRFSRFCRAHDRDRQTDRQTTHDLTSSSEATATDSRMSMNGVRMPAVNSIPSAPVLRTKSESIYIEHPSTHSSRCGTSSSDMPVRVPAVNIVAPLVYVFLVHLSDSPAVSVSHVTLSDKSATKKLHHLWRNHVGRSLAMARYGSFVI